MKLDRKLCALLQGLNKFSSLVRNKEARHILDTDRVSTHLLYLLSHVSPVLKSISITQCIGKCYLGLTAAFLLFNLICSINSSLKVTDIIKTVKYTYYINTVSY